MRNRILISGLLIFTITFVNLSSTAASEITDLGVVGITYEIKERDALEEMLERAERVDWNKVFSKDRLKEMVENFRPRGMKVLPPAEKDRTFKVDMTYTLGFDIKDKDGNIVYPRGYTFNPLDYMTYPYTIVVINPERDSELNWFKRSKYYRDYNVIFMVTDGVPAKLMEKLKRPVFYATAKVIERLKLEHTPSVVRQKGRYMEVREYAVEN